MALNIVAILNGGTATYVQTNAGIELKGITARGGLWVSKHDTYLLAQLVDEDTSGVRLADRCRQFSKGLTHQTGLKSHLVLTHVALYLCLRCKGCYRVNHYNIYCGTAYKLIGNFQGLLAIIGLTDKKVVGIHSQLLCIETVESVLGIYESGYATSLLGLGNSVDGQRRLTRRFRTIDFYDAPLGIPANAQGMVQTDRTRGDDLYIRYFLIAHLHD